MLGGIDLTTPGDFVLEVRDVSRDFAAPRRGILRRSVREVVRAVSNVSFRLRRGEVLGIVGESGSGKTTLARMLVRLIPPTSGVISFHGRDIFAMPEDEVRRHLRPRLRMIFQDPDAPLNPAYTVGVGLARAIRLHAPEGGADTDGVVTALLQRVGLDDSFGGKYPDELSGGEKRRVGICRALATNPELIVADEPLSGLDVVLQERVLELLMAERERRGFAVILVSHDLDRVNQVCDRALVMFRGRVVEDVVLRSAGGEMTAPYVHPYSVSLHGARDAWRDGVPGERELATENLGKAYANSQLPESLKNGCAYAERCGVRVHAGRSELCDYVSPLVQSYGDGHSVLCHFPDALSPK